MKTKIIFEDEFIVICHKPAGLATQTSKLGQQDMVSELKNYLSLNKQGKSNCGEPYLGVIHRLDQPVEGILIFAKTPEAAKELSQQITEHSVAKQYYAMIDLTQKEVDEQNKVANTKTVLIDYLVKDGKTNTSSIADKGTKEAKKAELEFQIKNQYEEYAVVEIHLITGRHHQIRVQMAHAGMPLLGDTKYGTKESIQKSEKLGMNKVALCAFQLEFIHPKTKKTMNFSIIPEGKMWGIQE